MLSIPGKTAAVVRTNLIVLIINCCIFVLISRVAARADVGYQEITIADTVHATGTSEIHLSSSLENDAVDGVVAERDGKNIPVEFSAGKGELRITPCYDFEGGATYSLKVFMASGKRYIIKVKTEEFPSFDTTRANTIKVPAKPSKGFNYAYFLHIPPNLDKLKDLRLLVECANTSPGSAQQFFEIFAQRDVSVGIVSVYANRLQVTALMPAFPREAYQGVKDYPYMQFLNRGALLVKGDKRERVDLQLLFMIKDARQLLQHNGIQVDEKVFMTGFSSSAKFAQRFTILHPEAVMAAAAGAIAGTTTYPVAEYNGEKLNYPVGVADLKALTGTDFDAAGYKKVPQFFFMGELDTNDVTQWRDCVPEEDAQQIWRLFGKQQIPDRWATTQKVLADTAPNIKCKTLPGIGHSTNEGVINDVVEFFKSHWTR